MIDFSATSNILWDFDGVIMDSMAVRNRGFELVLKGYPDEQVERLLAYHLKNGGLSRYVKFRYFFEMIRGEFVTDEKIIELAQEFSVIMRGELCNRNLLIDETIDFIERHNQRFRMHITSGSDEQELRFICNNLDIARYFLSIHGSPTPKNKLVEAVIQENHYNTAATILIGDSINDAEAANKNDIQFAGYNNPSLKEAGYYYIQSFKQFYTDSQ